MILKVALIVAVIITAVIGGFIILESTSHKTQSANLAHGDFWLNFPGAVATNAGIHFQPLGRMIVHQDGSAGQPNPPVNLGGAHLKIAGDFKITATLLSIDKWASFRLYAKPPIVYDQWRYENPGLDINIDASNNLITARLWDGSSSNSMDMRTYKIVLTTKTAVSVEHKNGQLIITQNNRVLGNMPDHNIFTAGSVWFGSDGAQEGKGWTLSALNAEGVGNGRVEVVTAPLLTADQNDPNSLRSLADKNPRKIKIGSAIALSPLITDEQYKNLALSQFSMLTPENNMKPAFIHPRPDFYDFEEADQLVAVAQKNNMVVHGHVLVYDKSTPDWMNKTAKEQRQEVMVSHIKNVVSHFKGKVAEWDVVNEPFGKKGLEPNIWFEAMGEDYIDIAFKTAREADPNAKLYLNDYGLENDGKRWDAFLALIKKLKQKKVPIDGVGFEAHVYGEGDYINPEQLKQHMQILADLGLLTRISEIDVTGDDPQEQIDQYAAALATCLGAPNCASYTTWGITDLYGSNTRSDRYPLVMAPVCCGTSI